MDWPQREPHPTGLTVAELIEKLRQFPPEEYVYNPAGDNNMCWPVEDVEWVPKPHNGSTRGEVWIT